MSRRHHRTIEELEATPIRGSYNGDHQLVDDASEFALDESKPMADRCRALRVLDLCMGEDTQPTEKDVHDYVNMSA